MREKDLKQLDVKYASNAEDIFRFAKAINVSLDALQTLQQEVFQDLDTKTYGIGWWKGYDQLDFKRRVLISDQLWQSLFTIQDTIVEAKLYLLEILDWWEREDLPMKDAVQFVNGELTMVLPKRLKPLDDLPNHLGSLHIKGYFGALCSAIDCLSAGIVGVLGIRVDLIKVGFSSLKGHLKKEFNYANSFQKQTIEQIKEAEEKVGPTGWLNWMTDFRNMATHRGRRIQFSRFEPDEEEINGHPRTKVVRCMTRNPAVSEVESLKDGSLEFMSEAATVTLEETLTSTIKLIENVSGILLVAWQNRRANTNLIVQPKE